jgi:hypothetical protein
MTITLQEGPLPNAEVRPSAFGVYSATDFSVPLVLLLVDVTLARDDCRIHPSEITRKPLGRNAGQSRLVNCEWMCRQENVL